MTGAPRTPAVGLRLPQYAAGWEELRASAERAERRGFAALWLNDHLQTPGRVRRSGAFEAFTTLGALAAVTQRTRLGVAVAAAGYRPAPLLARMTTVLDVISSGRMILGLGSGSDAGEHRAYGLEFPAPAARSARLLETLDVVEAMFADPESATLPGRLEAAPNLPPPVQRPRPPLWLAAHRARLLRVAGARADGIVAAFCDAAELARRREIAAQARGDGHPPLAVCIYTYALPVVAEREAESWLAGEARALGTRPARLLRWLRGTGVVGPPEHLREELAAFGAAGATDCVLVLPNRAPAEAIDALADAVLVGSPTPKQREPGTRRAGGDPAANVGQLLVERHREAGRGGDLAVRDESGEWSFDELGEAAARTAGALEGAGVRRGERVAILLRDGRPWMRVALGTAWRGAVLVPLDPATERDRLAAVLEDCEPTLVIAEPESCPPGWPALDPRELDGAPRPLAPVHPEDLSYLIYSSGSTGLPKAAMHAHRDMAVSVEGYAAEVLGLGPGDRAHSVARLFTSLGFGNGFFRPLGCGAAAVLSGTRPTPRSVLALTADAGVSLLTAVPTFWSQLARYLERHDGAEALASVRLAVSSGDALPAPIAAALTAASGLTLIEGLGCSECSNVVLSTRPGEPAGEGLGAPTPGVEVKLADEAGHPVPPGAPGRLWIRSESNTSGYWRRAELTRELVVGAWLRMGDVLIEREGRLRHVGRADDLFKVDGHWVSPSAVEASVLDHPSVAEAAVVGRPDARGLVRVAAYVVLAPGSTAEGLAEALRRHVAHELAPHMAPQRVTPVDALPRLPSGKLDRRALP